MKLLKALQKTVKPVTKMIKKGNKLMLLLGVLLLLALVLVVGMYMKKREGFTTELGEPVIYGTPDNTQSNRLWEGANPPIPDDFIPQGKIAMGYPSTNSGAIGKNFRGMGRIYKYPGTDRGNLYVCVFKDSMYVKFAYFKIESGKYKSIGRRYFAFDANDNRTQSIMNKSTQLNDELEVEFYRDFPYISTSSTHTHYKVLWPADEKILNGNQYQLAYIKIFNDVQKQEGIKQEQMRIKNKLQNDMEITVVDTNTVNNVVVKAKEKYDDLQTTHNELKTNHNELKSNYYGLEDVLKKQGFIYRPPPPPPPPLMVNA